jgi:hypothetical protein
VTPDDFVQATAQGRALFAAVLAIILLGSALKLFLPQWDDWLDERLGRGGVRDDWGTTRSGDDGWAAWDSNPEPAD